MSQPLKSWRHRRTGPRVLGVLLLAGVIPAPGAADPGKLEQAAQYYEQASAARAAVESLPQPERTLAAYLKSIQLYRSVYRTSPQSSKADDSLLAIGQLYEQMGGQIGPEPHREKAAEAYRFLIREYPHSQFVKEARRKLEGLESVSAAARPVALPTESQPAAAPPPAAERHQAQQVVAIRHWSLPGLTRVVVDLEAEVSAKAERLANPDRVYFDLPNTRLSSGIKSRTLPVNDALVSQIRVAQTQLGVTRVVVDLTTDSAHSLTTLTNPPRLVLELKPRAAAAAIRPAAPPDKPRETTVVEASPPKVSEPVPPPVTVRAETTITPPPAPPPTQVKPPAPTSVEPPVQAPVEAPVHSKVQAKVVPPKPFLLPPPALETNPPPRAGVSTRPGPKPKAAQPTSRGERNLTRTLGLKIARVVIDAGHGGYDTGTVGPTGLMEKDLALDLALRLGTLVSERIGSEVVYTRTEDAFIPLEERTALANDRQADLFISIHANSSRASSTRGIETYYLNLTGDRYALEVAARENAAVQKSVHDLQELVTRITLTEKVTESREFAGQVQRSLHSAMSRESTALRNRGVRKAPFVVLIGAQMPSVLAEISFLSNPRDERLLKTVSYRQRIAEALFNGLAGYARTLSRLEVAAK